MNSLELLYFLYFWKRIVVLDCLDFGYFARKNGQDFLLLLGREAKLLCYRLTPFLSKRGGCQQRKDRDGYSRGNDVSVFLHISPLIWRARW